MTDALVNNKPQFVRLFTENGLNILDYLTYGRLESLYRSVADSTVLYHLLQRRLVERLGTAASTQQDSASRVAAEHIHSGPGTEISLFEVGDGTWFCPRPIYFKKNLKKIMHNNTNICICLLP